MERCGGRSRIAQVDMEPGSVLLKFSNYLQRHSGKSFAILLSPGRHGPEGSFTR
jgi:hypothetical protein